MGFVTFVFGGAAYSYPAGTARGSSCNVRARAMAASAVGHDRCGRCCGQATRGEWKRADGRVKMKVVPAVGVEQRAALGAFQDKAGLARDSARRWVGGRMVQKQP